MFSMTCSSVEVRESYLSRRQLFFAYGKLSTITGLKCDCSFSILLVPPRSRL